MYNYRLIRVMEKKHTVLSGYYSSNSNSTFQTEIMMIHWNLIIPIFMLFPVITCI